MIIIKSRTRKDKSFSQLYNYLTREKSFATFSKNTYFDSQNKKQFIKEFYENAKHIQKSRGSVYIYHDVISLKNSSLSKNREKEILLDLAKKYLSLRANNHLAFGVIHDNTDNTHVHLMFSSNEIEGNQRVRINQAEFLEIQASLESYKNKTYSELEQSGFYQNKKDLSKDKVKEQKLKNRGVKSIKQEIKENLIDTFDKSTSQTYLSKHLENLGYEIYTRGKIQGVTYKGKKYRFKTLGLDVQYKQLLNRLERIQTREIKREKSKQEKLRYSRER